MANFDLIVPFTLEKEAGLSNDPNDNASSYPSPYYFNGSNNWHTNKGITYKTFEKASEELNFENNFQNFIVMPKNIWSKIAKKLFWDKLNLDKLNNQGIANILFSWFWGSGYNWRNRIKNYLAENKINWNKNDFKALIKHLNHLVKVKGSKSVYNAIEKQYIAYLKSLNQSYYIVGWLNRLKDLREISSKYLNNKKILVTGLVLLSLAYIINKS